MQILSSVRRFVRKRQVFGADWPYIPQISRRVPSPGFRQRVALWPYGISAIGPALCLFSDTFSRPAAGLTGALFCGAVWIGLQHLSLSEVGLATGLFVRGPFRQIIDLQFRLEEFEQSLANAGDMEQCWETIQAGCRDFGFYGGKWSARGRVFETAKLPAGLSAQWQLRVPLADAQYVNLYRDPDAEDHPAVIGKLAGILRSGLQARFAEWERDVPQVALRLQRPAVPIGAVTVRSLTAAAR